MRLAQAFVELLWTDRPPPQISMLLSSRRDDPQAAPGPGAHSPAPNAIDHRRVDLIFTPVAIDSSSGSPGDHCAAAALERAPYQAIDERIFESRQSGPAGSGKGNEPVGIVAARVRDRQQHRKVAARFVDDWRGELAHGLFG
jgi:hypothetical protein